MVLIGFVIIALSLLFCQSEGTAPTVQLLDGKNMPTLALGTWLGNSSQICDADLNALCRSIYLSFGEQHHNSRVYDNCPAKRFSNSTNENGEIFIEHNSYLLGKFLKGRVHSNGHEVFTAVQWALEAGYRHIDTASAYGVENQVGRGVRECVKRGLVKREDVFVTTNLWSDSHARSAVVPALRASLERLGLDYVDLYLIHWPVALFANRSFDNIDYVETYRGMLDAQQLGLTKSIGVSNFNRTQIDRIVNAGLGKPAVLQVEVNLNLQQPDLLSYCKAQGIAVMGYTPYGSMFKAAPDAPPPRADDPKLVEIAAKHNKTVPQIVLRYLVELGVTPIPKSLNKSRIEENIAIFDFQLSVEDRKSLEGFHINYRTIAQVKWKTHPDYPFEQATEQNTIHYT